jgi:hypothetical protein
MAKALKKIRTLLKRPATGYVDALPSHIKEGIEKSRLHAKEGKLKPLKQVLKDLKGK